MPSLSNTPDAVLNQSSIAPADTHLVEHFHSRQVLDSSGFLEMRRDTVRLPHGGLATRDYVVHPGAVVVVGLLDDGQVLLERQFRYPVGRVMTEFPAGKLDAGEDPLVCAQRELLEETGYTAREWAKAVSMHLAIGYSDEVLHIYFARGLQPGVQQLDADEFLDVIKLPVPALLVACQRGEITDAKTLSCCLWLQNVLSGQWTLDWQAL